MNASPNNRVNGSTISAHRTFLNLRAVEVQKKNTKKIENGFESLSIWTHIRKSIPSADSCKCFPLRTYGHEHNLQCRPLTYERDESFFMFGWTKTNFSISPWKIHVSSEERHALRHAWKPTPKIYTLLYRRRFIFYGLGCPVWINSAYWFSASTQIPHY